MEASVESLSLSAVSPEYSIIDTTEDSVNLNDLLYMLISPSGNQEILFLRTRDANSFAV